MFVPDKPQPTVETSLLGQKVQLVGGQTLHEIVAVVARQEGVFLVLRSLEGTTEGRLTGEIGIGRVVVRSNP